MLSCFCICLSAHSVVCLCRAFLNPGAGKRRTGISSSPWAAQEGQDFLANHVVPSIDLVTTHIWADNWMGCAAACWLDMPLYAQTQHPRQLSSCAQMVEAC